MEKEMQEMMEYRLAVGERHPEKAEIFHLEAKLIEMGVPYYFNIWEDLRPTPFNDALDPETSIDWNTYNFLIEAGRLADNPLAQISVCLDKDVPGKLELLDMQDALKKDPYDDNAMHGLLRKGLTAEQAAKRIREMYDNLE